MILHIRLAFIATLLFLISITLVFSQELQFRFEANSIPVQVNGKYVANPFGGSRVGIKPTFVDIDQDGDLDLFTRGQKYEVLFYRNTGSPTNPNFSLETVRFVDFGIELYTNPCFGDIDNDGDPDILFTGSPGLVIIRNVGTLGNPHFEIDTTYTSSLQAPRGISNLTLVDIDEDGDLDLFSGEKYGHYINYYENLGTIDNPAFDPTPEHFKDIYIGYESTVCFADIDYDGDPDLFAGEKDGSIHFYQNDGPPQNPTFNLITRSYADIITSKEYSVPTFADIDADGDLDLFVGMEWGYSSKINFYKNIGTVSNEAYTLEDETLIYFKATNRSVAFADIDADGDEDLFVGGGHQSSIGLYINNGDAEDYSFSTPKSVSNSGNTQAPALADIDDDGDFDLFVGNWDGEIDFYRNTGNVSSPTFTLESAKYLNIDVGNNSKPALTDIDADGDLDLFIGSNFQGKIYFYRNQGTKSTPNFVFVTDNYRQISAGWHTAPTFVDFNHDGDFDLFVGNGEGTIKYYQNIGSAKSPNFRQEEGNFYDIDVGSYSTPAFTDIDADGDLDLFIGEQDGNINFYRKEIIITDQKFIFETDKLFSYKFVNESCTPAFADLDGDNDLDMFIGSREGNIIQYLNIGTSQEPAFRYFRTLMQTYGNSHPYLVDIDNDSDFDLFVTADEYSWTDDYKKFTFYRNIGSSRIPQFVEEPGTFPDMNGFWDFTFADIDNDQDMDLIASFDWNLKVYRNVGTPSSPAFELEENDFITLLTGYSLAPTFGDLDGDGDLDIIMGEKVGSLRFYRNNGTLISPFYLFEQRQIISIQPPSGGMVQIFSAEPSLVDIDSDNDLDLFVGHREGGIYFFRNIYNFGEAGDFIKPPQNAIAQHDTSQTIVLEWQPSQEDEVVAKMDTTELFYDDGTYESVLRGVYTNVKFAVRFTPTSYPATILAISFLPIYPVYPVETDRYKISIGIDPDALDEGPIGSAKAPGVGGSVGFKTGSIVNVLIPPITVEKGDFYVSLGYYKQWKENITYNLYLALDETDYQHRSWVLDPWDSWFPIHTFEGLFRGGNFMIRALVLTEKGLEGGMPPENIANALPITIHSIQNNLLQGSGTGLERFELTKISQNKIFQFSLMGNNSSVFQTIDLADEFKYLEQEIAGTLLGYNIYKSTSFPVLINPENLTGNVNSLTRKYEDSQIMSNQIYHYAITALNEEGESGPSNIVSINAIYGNNAPFVLKTLPDTTITLDKQEIILDLAGQHRVFSDPDGDELLYVVKVSDDEIVSVQVTENIITFTLLETGNVTVTITADDSKGGTVETTFKIIIVFPTSVNNNDQNLPDEFALFQNYPNPFNPSTTIHFAIPKSSLVTLRIYNLLGQEIETLTNEQKPAGEYKVNWAPVNLPSGIYLYRLKAEDFDETRKLMLLK